MMTKEQNNADLEFKETYLAVVNAAARPPTRVMWLICRSTTPEPETIAHTDLDKAHNDIQ